MNFVRHPDGSLVRRGVPHVNDGLPALYRLPTRWLPDTAPDVLVTVAPTLFWAGLGWILYRAFGR